MCFCFGLKCLILKEHIFWLKIMKNKYNTRQSCVSFFGTFTILINSKFLLSFLIVFPRVNDFCFILSFAL